MSTQAFIDCNKYLDESGPCVSYVEVWEAATLDERERCAKVCETWAKGHAKADGCTYSDCDFVAAAQDCAAAIRALPDGGT